MESYKGILSNILEKPDFLIGGLVVISSLCLSFGCILANMTRRPPRARREDPYEHIYLYGGRAQTNQMTINEAYNGALSCLRRKGYIPKDFFDAYDSLNPREIKIITAKIMDDNGLIETWKGYESASDRRREERTSRANEKYPPKGQFYGDGVKEDVKVGGLVYLNGRFYDSNDVEVIRRRRSVFVKFCDDR